jgi:hypothetical protein
MPKMTYVQGVGRVRAGSWSTKPVPERWRLAQKALEDAPLAIMRLAHLLFEEGSEFSSLAREAYEEEIVWQLEHLRDHVSALLARFPRERRIAALENVAGRTPEEAAVYLAKAAELRGGSDA